MDGHMEGTEERTEGGKGKKKGLSQLGAITHLYAFAQVIL